MAVDVQKEVKECEVCKITKTANKNDRPPMAEQRVTERAGQRLFIDFMEPYPRTKAGNSVIFVCLDHFSKSAAADETCSSCRSHQIPGDQNFPSIWGPRVHTLGQRQAICVSNFWRAIDPLRYSTRKD